MGDPKTDMTSDKMETDEADTSSHVQRSRETENCNPPVVSDHETDHASSCCRCCVRKRPFRLRVFIRKYFWEGQHLLPTQEDALRSLPEDAKWYKKVLVRYRRVVAVVIPSVIVLSAWLAVMVAHNHWNLFPEKYFMTITMVFGSLVAGMTSEGGGAVAFPVMTLAFGIPPSVARDFSVAIQSVGMTAAAFTLIYMQIQLEWHSIFLGTFGGIIGVVFGFEIVDPALTSAQKKLSFVCIWFTFAFALFGLNIYHKRRTFPKIPNFNWWKGIVLVLTGFFGGIFTSFAGSGLDICSFSVLTLLFRVSEKIATPTSIVLMAGNTSVGLFWRHVIMGHVDGECWQYVAVCVPVVIFGAPLGSVIGSHFHRLVLAGLIYVLDTVALVAAFAIVRPLSTELVLMSVGIIVFGAVFFFCLTRAGTRFLRSIEDAERKAAKVGDMTELDKTINDKNKDTEPNTTGMQLHENITEI